MLAIIGLGYVGLPLCLQFARNGVQVLGLDIDTAKVEAINSGNSYIHHIARESILEQVDSGRLVSSDDFSRVAQCEAVIICVPTPLSKNREPDISYILKTAEAISPHLTPGTFIVLESTTYPGTTDEDLKAALELGSGFRAGIDFNLAFSPEREDPGNPDSKVAKIPKVVGGLTPHLFGACYLALFRSDENDRAGLQLPNGGSDKVTRKHLPQRQYPARQRTDSRIKRDGNRYLGSHRSGQVQFVRLHAVLPWSRPGRTLLTDRSVLSNPESS